MNKEEKYRDEIFDLLSTTFGGLDNGDLRKLKEIFLEDKMNKESLISKIFSE